MAVFRFLTLQPERPFLGKNTSLFGLNKNMNETPESAYPKSRVKKMLLITNLKDQNFFSKTNVGIASYGIFPEIENDHFGKNEQSSGLVVSAPDSRPMGHGFNLC